MGILLSLTGAARWCAAAALWGAEEIARDAVARRFPHVNRFGKRSGLPAVGRDAAVDRVQI